MKRRLRTKHYVIIVSFNAFISPNHLKKIVFLIIKSSPTQSAIKTH